MHNTRVGTDFTESCYDSFFTLKDLTAKTCWRSFGLLFGGTNQNLFRYNNNNYSSKGALVVAQLVEWSLPTSEIRAFESSHQQKIMDYQPHWND